jgi:Protein of unknown function (DUF4031)
MAVYVDDVRTPSGGMLGCRMWADTPAELLDMARRIGLQRVRPLEPASPAWVHFDISPRMKAKALAAGAVLTDRYGASEHLARIRGNQSLLDTIAAMRARRVAAE